MALTTRRIQLSVLLLFSIAAVAVVCRFDPPSIAAPPNPAPFKTLLDLRARVTNRASRIHRITSLQPGKVYSLSISLPTPERLSSQDRVSVILRKQNKTVAAKILHLGDPDLYTLFRGDASDCRVEITSPTAVPIDYQATILEWPASTSATASIETEPNDSFNEANEIVLGQTVWATTDDKPYIVPPDSEAESGGALPYEQTAVASKSAVRDRLPLGGVDWFKFTYDADQPKLVYFEIDLLERDNIPVDVSVYRVEKGTTEPYERGVDPVSPPHEVQALPGNKFTTRVVSRGTYYIRVDANHPFYQLRTSVSDLPPYDDPRKSVKAGVDYLLGAGDSWHANTPRHGGIVNRVSSVHAETTTCIACHATHFTMRGALTAKQNGYAIEKRPQMQFLAERLYNNPRPFYGHPDATWTRVISAAANVSSRLAALLNTYENEVSGERRTEVLKGVGGYLKIYYKGRTSLPSDESNGNTPLVSTYEVAFYSWRAFDELFLITRDEEYRRYRDQVRGLIEQDQHKNVVDICYQTIALVTIDRSAYSDKIRRNSERLLSLQRADGQWSMLFEPETPSVEFQTGHALYTLALAGYSKDHPQISKGLGLLLARQQEFGGWFDPRQSYENFRTPFRETQFAVMALSQFFKGDLTARGWNAGFQSQPLRVSGTDPLLGLEQMDRVWEKPGPPLAGDLVTSLASPDGLVRVAAAAALGRIGDRTALAPLIVALDDRQKMVQLAAAQAIRRIAERDQTGYAEIARALRNPRGRARWGATRIFAQHFASFAGRNELAEQLIGLQSDPLVTVRMQSSKALAQWFYWTKDERLKARIADAFIARLAVREHSWARRNLVEGLYSLADENVRYLYDNWIALIAGADDRERAVKGHRAESRMMAERIARALESGNELQRDGILRGLTEFHLRTGGYAGGGRYTRIGNDIETVRFYQEGAQSLERALIGAVTSPSADRRAQAVLASNALRDTRLSTLPILVMERLIDPDPAVRQMADEFYRALPLTIGDDNRQQAAAAMRRLLASDRDEAKIAALDRVNLLGSGFIRNEGFERDIKEFVMRAGGKVAPAAMRALADYPSIANDSEVQGRIAGALGSSDMELLRAGVQLVLKRPELKSLPPVRAALDTLFATGEAMRRRAILGLITTDSRVEDDLRLLTLVEESLADRDEQVRLAALGAVRRVRALQSSAAIRPAIARLMKDPNQRIQGQAIALYQGQDGSSIAIDGRDASRPLDYQFFARRVMPILERKGADGNACINCHSTHTVFRLQSGVGGGRSTDASIRENYQSALRVVDLANPEMSLILRKPTSDSEQEGVVGARKLSHGGGQRWLGTEDAAYRTILEWINGARLEDK